MYSLTHASATLESLAMLADRALASETDVEESSRGLQRLRSTKLLN